MERTKFIGCRLACGWLLTCMGCGLFRNTAKHRESVHTETRKSTQQLSDSMAVHTVDIVDFAALGISNVSEAAIGFIAEGNVVLYPDGTVAADRMRGEVSRSATETWTKATGSHKQQRSIQAVSGMAETLETQVHDTASKKKHTRPNRAGYIILFVVSFGIGMLCWYRLKSG